jgi:hypothetical protein
MAEHLRNRYINDNIILNSSVGVDAVDSCAI